MVAHRQKKRRRHLIGRREQRNAVLFLPIGIFDETGLELGRNQLSDRRDHPSALVTSNKVRPFDSRVDQRVYRVTNQRTTKQRHERLRESFVGAATTR